jgi:molybdenum cofactor cytidylyltransferase
MKISAIVLAGGKSTRMGQNKLLLPWDGSSVIRHVVGILSTCPFVEIIVVTGYDAASVEKELSKTKAAFVRNEAYELGMATSIKIGLSATDAQADAILIALGDMPLIQESLIQESLRRADPNSIIVPRKGDRLGQPITFGSRFISDLLRLHGDRGAKLLLAQHGESIDFIDVDDEKIFDDIDTAEHYVARQKR